MEKNTTTITTAIATTTSAPATDTEKKVKAGDTLIKRASEAVENLGYTAVVMNYGQYIKVEKDGKKVISIYRRSDGLRIVDMPTAVFEKMPATYTGKLDGNGQFTGAMLVKKPVIAGKYTAHYIAESHIEKALAMALKAMEDYKPEKKEKPAKAKPEKPASKKATSKPTSKKATSKPASKPEKPATDNKPATEGKADK